jgi:MFS family permease
VGATSTPQEHRARKERERARGSGPQREIPFARRLPAPLRKRVRRATRTMGGVATAETVVLLALVLALDSADRASLGALAPGIRSSFHISNTQLGLLASAFSIVGGLATVPVGALTDRVNRVRLLTASIVVWSVAMVASGLAVTFFMLFAARLLLGAVTATGGPTVASLTGDLYPPSERGRILSWIRSGELVGAGFGFLLAGAVAVVFDWRGVFVILAVLGLLIARGATRLPEPARGAQGGAGTARSPGDEARRGDITGRLVHESGVAVDETTIVRDDPSQRSLWWAARYVLRVRTNVIVIVASSIGDFFFAGLQLFAVEFVIHQYGIGKYTATVLIPVVGVGALTGMLVSGRITDRLLERGYLNARIAVSAWSFVLGAALLVPAFLSRSLYLALPLFVLGGACLAAPNPPMDAARLDVIDPRLWGRAEGVRTLFRILAQALAPITFGLLADALGGGRDQGLQLAFLLMTPTLVANGLVLLLALRTYPRDVASAQASGDLVASRSGEPR